MALTDYVCNRPRIRPTEWLLACTSHSIDKQIRIRVIFILHRYGHHHILIVSESITPQANLIHLRTPWRDRALFCITLPGYVEISKLLAPSSHELTYWTISSSKTLNTCSYPGFACRNSRQRSTSTLFGHDQLLTYQAWTQTAEVSVATAASCKSAWLTALSTLFHTLSSVIPLSLVHLCRSRFLFQIATTNPIFPSGGMAPNCHSTVKTGCSLLIMTSLLSRLALILPIPAALPQSP